MQRTTLLVLALISLVSLTLCATTTVTATGLSFASNSATISVGDTVTWIGLSTHNVAQVASPTASTRLTSGFYSGAVGSQSTYSLTFNSALVGNTTTFYYICEAHVSSGMRGSITISSTPGSTASSKTPALLPLVVLLLLFIF
jgi:plastocyanin